MDNPTYRLKRILSPVSNERTSIVTQSVNGPCPLLALANALVLRGVANIHEDHAVLASTVLVQIISDSLLAIHRSSKSGVADLGSQSRSSCTSCGGSGSRDGQRCTTCLDIPAALRHMETGLDCDVAFGNVAGVSDVSSSGDGVAVMHVAGVRLFHCWLAAPDNAPDEVLSVLQDATYESLTLRLAYSDEKEGDATGEGDDEAEEEESVTAIDPMVLPLVTGWLAEHGDQVTDAGLAAVAAAMQPDELAVAFRNNHFLTLYRRGDDLYSLLSDQGFYGSPYTWELLHSAESGVPSEPIFVDENFATVTDESVALAAFALEAEGLPRTPEPPATQRPVGTSGQQPSEAEDADLARALELSLTDTGPSPLDQSVEGQQPSEGHDDTDDDADLAAALALSMEATNLNSQPDEHTDTAGDEDNDDEEEDDDDDEDLAAALAMSLEQTRAPDTMTPPPAMPRRARSPASDVATSNGRGKTAKVGGSSASYASSAATLRQLNSERMERQRLRAQREGAAAGDGQAAPVASSTSTSRDGGGGRASHPQQKGKDCVIA